LFGTWADSLVLARVQIRETSPHIARAGNLPAPGVHGLFSSASSADRHRMDAIQTLRLSRIPAVAPISLVRVRQDSSSRLFVDFLGLGLGFCALRPERLSAVGLTPAPYPLLT
jgi:hypothetical protein